MPTLTSFARNVKAMREESGITQQQLAESLGVSRLTVNKWERGDVDRPRQPEIIANLRQLFGVSDEELFGYNDGYYALKYGTTGRPPGSVGVSGGVAARVPVRVLGTTYASSPDTPFEFEDETLLYEDIAKRHPNCFALRVSGSCMDRVFTEYDYIFVDPDMQLCDGSIAVMLVDGNSETRRVKLGNGSMMLVSESHDPRPDIIICDGDGHEVACQGIVFWWQAAREAQ